MLILLYITAWITEDKTPINEISEMEIICYSCGRGENPENTIIGIEHCQSVNPNWRIEMDIQITKDERLVLFHDYNTKRITGEDKQINELTLDETRELNVGYNFKFENQYVYRNNPIQIPELESVFKQFPQAKLLLDVHTNNLLATEKLIELVEKYSLVGNIIVASHYDEVIAAFKGKRPNWKYGVPANEAKKMIYSSFLYLDNLFPIKSDVLMLPQKAGKINVLTKRVINHAKKRNKKLWAWMYEGEIVKNVDSRAELLKMKEIGADGVFTDYPQKLINEIQ